MSVPIKKVTEALVKDKLIDSWNQWHFQAEESRDIIPEDDILHFLDFYKHRAKQLEKLVKVR